MEGVDKEFARTFGNYILHGIEEVSLPESVSWVPQTTAWKVLFVALCLGLMIRLYYFGRKVWRNRYRRAALKRLSELESQGCDAKVLSELSVLLKATSLHAFPREQVASLVGKTWLEFLSTSSRKVSFDDHIGHLLVSQTYQDASINPIKLDELTSLIKKIRIWIETHENPADKTNRLFWRVR
jgi:hypothetical protein